MNRNHWRGWGATLAVAVGLTTFIGDTWSARESNVRQTKHNLSSSGPGTLKATTETQVCVFCHTPHGATPAVNPLWNRQLSGQTYQTYTSSSLDAQAIEGQLAQPGGSSKLCLSCHDGTLAIGNVNVLNGAGSATAQGTRSITMTGTGPDGVMASGSGTSTGFTRFLGTDLSNDHPISMTYNKLLTDRDGELRDATLNPIDGTWEWVSGSSRIIGVRKHYQQGGTAQAKKPVLPFEMTGSATDAGQVQCATCHDPHIRETNEATIGNQKFLRQNRFQEATPTNAYNEAGDQICLSCHNKNRGSGTWAFSAHANPLVATPTYKPAAATQREFPVNQPVWKAACLNCHDTHSVPGSRRLLREGTDSTSTPKTGGSSAIEETCYQCHTTSASSVITPTTTVPDIRTDFTGKTYRMPITSAAQAAGTEKHDIGGNFSDTVDCTSTTNRCGKDFIESQVLLGRGPGNLINRHAECTDCHNPHRVVKFRDFRGTNGAGVLSGPPDAGGTHRHDEASGYIHTNLASGVLRGSWGVEPIYSSPSFQTLPTGYTVKRGDPGNAVDASTAAPYVTREYQICLKCHSDYAYSDDNAYPNSTSRPQLGGPGKTSANTGGHVNFTSYTNQAKEFQAPAGHNVTVGSVSRGHEGGAGTGRTQNNANNHRSWHPVMAPTGRTNRAGDWIAPWNNTGTGGQSGRLGVQTMYCSDCHGSETTGATVIPAGGENGSPWGPHGSNNTFLLKGQYDTNSGEGNANTLCFKCHSQTAYSGGGGTGWSTDKGDGHSVHSDRIDNPLRCNWCHIAVPHGWKNRNLLVNLLDVGPEGGGTPAGTAVAFTNNVGYSNGPYYRKAFLRIISFPAAGNQWTEANCNGGSKATMKTNCEVPN